MRDRILDDDDPVELVELEEEAFLSSYRSTVEKMIETSDWYYVDGIFKGSLSGIDFRTARIRKVTGHKHLALGRSTYYDRFMRVRAEACGHKVYQSDYMVWIRATDPYRSLMYYIETAELIDFSLEGVSPDDVRIAAAHGRAAVDRRDLGSPYMTTWELNRILYSPYHEKTAWHLPKPIERAPYLDAFARAGIEAHLV